MDKPMQIQTFNYNRSLKLKRHDQKDVAQEN